MFSQRVQLKRCGRPRGVLNTFLKAGCLVLFSVGTLTANAQWQDPLVTPSYQTQKVHESLLLDIARANERLVAVGSFGHIIYSDNDGVTWHQAAVPVTTTLTSVHFVSGSIGWAAGHDGVILKTTDGGKNWVKQFDGYRANQEIVDSVARAYKQAEAHLAEVADTGSDSQVEAAEARVESLEMALGDASYDLETGSTKPFLDLWFYDANRGFVAGAYGMLFYTEDGGKNWQNYSLRLPNPENLHLNSIGWVGGQSLMIVGERGLILRSDDFGQSWRGLDSPYSGSLFGLAADGNNQLIYGLRGNVFATQNGGITWQSINTKNEQTLIGGLVTKQKSYVLGNGGVIIEFDKNNKPTVHRIEGSKAFSGLVQTVNGSLVLVGEAGVMRLSSSAKLLKDTISTVAGGN